MMTGSGLTAARAYNGAYLLEPNKDLVAHLKEKIVLILNWLSTNFHVKRVAQTASDLFPLCDNPQYNFCSAEHL